MIEKPINLRDKYGKFIIGHEVGGKWRQSVSKAQKNRKKTAKEIEDIRGRLVTEHASGLRRESYKKSALTRTGKPLSEKHRHNLSIAHIGKTMSLESRMKLSKSTTGKKKKPYTEEQKRKSRESHLGLVHTKETRKLMSRVHKERIKNNPKFREMLINNRKNMTFPLKDSSIEIKIQNFLKELKVEFFTHQYMHIEHGYQCDIFIPSMNLIIECDGDYWHGNPEIFPNPSEMQLRQREEDSFRTRELLNDGYKVLRLWESEIKELSLDKFKERIWTKINL